VKRARAGMSAASFGRQWIFRCQRSLGGIAAFAIQFDLDNETPPLVRCCQLAVAASPDTSWEISEQPTHAETKRAMNGKGRNTNPARLCGNEIQANRPPSQWHTEQET